MINCVHFKSSDNRFWLLINNEIEEEILEEDWIAFKSRFEEITQNRPRSDQFPESKLDFLETNLTKTFLNFYNGFYVTNEEMQELCSMYLSALRNKLKNESDVYILGRYPGQSCKVLMSDGGFYTFNA
jgi:hypothetical protein